MKRDVEGTGAMVSVEQLDHSSKSKLNLIGHLLRKQSVYIGFLGWRGASPQRALDLFQELILKILEPSFRTFPKGKKIGAWVRSSLRNAHIDSIRHDRHEVVEQPDVLEALRGHSDSGEQEYEGCSCLVELMESMNAKDKEILVQLMNSEESHLPRQRKPGAAYTQTHRAKKKLLKKLIECCGSSRFKDYLSCNCEGG